MLKHSELCDRAAQWLRGTKRCNPVLSGIASTSEVPDAIGWMSHGSIVVECKTSIGDFYADAQKYVRYKHPDDKHPCQGYPIKAAGRIRQLKERGYIPVVMPSMGTYRFFLCEPGVLEVTHLKDRPDHGLLHLVRNRVRVILPAPIRQEVDLQSELRCLRFALVHLHENLLRRGCTVDLAELTKHWSRERDGISFPKTGLPAVNKESQEVLNFA